MGKRLTNSQAAKAEARALAAVVYPGERLDLDREGREVWVVAWRPGRPGFPGHARYIAVGRSRSRAWRDAVRRLRAQQAGEAA